MRQRKRPRYDESVASGAPEGRPATTSIAIVITIVGRQPFLAGPCRSRPIAIEHMLHRIRNGVVARTGQRRAKRWSAFGQFRTRRRTCLSMQRARSAALRLRSLLKSRNTSMHNESTKTSITTLYRARHLPFGALQARRVKAEMPIAATRLPFPWCSSMVCEVSNKGTDKSCQRSLARLKKIRTISATDSIE